MQLFFTGSVIFLVMLSTLSAQDDSAYYTE